MARVQRLTASQLKSQTAATPEWAELDGAIQRTFQFADFLTAMKFVNQIAGAAEADQHHPDILIRYNKVTLTLTTHDAGGLSKKDFELAKRADTMFGPLAPPPTPGA